LKFRILPKVSGFRKGLVRYLPGDIVDLPASYLGEKWLEPIEKPVERKPEVMAEVVEPEIPFETPVPPSNKRSRKKKSES
jgi:hypothetical protein